MNHQKTHQTNPLAPWEPPDIPLDPIGPQGRPFNPFRAKNNLLDPIGPLRSPGLPYKSSGDPSNGAADSMGHLRPSP